MCTVVFAPDEPDSTTEFYDNTHLAASYKLDLEDDYEDVDMIDIPGVTAEQAEKVWEAIGG